MNINQHNITSIEISLSTIRVDGDTTKTVAIQTKDAKGEELEITLFLSEHGKVILK